MVTIKNKVNKIQNLFKFVQNNLTADVIYVKN